jgi:hypothetical protein
MIPVTWPPSAPFARRYGGQVFIVFFCHYHLIDFGQ